MGLRGNKAIVVHGVTLGADAPYEQLIKFIEEFDDMLQRYEDGLYGMETEA